MPITVVFDSKTYQKSVQDIIKEHLQDYFPKEYYTITFDAPNTGNITKPIVWLHLEDGKEVSFDKFLDDNRNVVSASRKLLQYAVALVTTEATGRDVKCTEMASTFEVDAILRGKGALGAAGLKRAEVTPFTTVLVASQQKQWWLVGKLRCEVLVKRG